jgi:hypothetical protein
MKASEIMKMHNSHWGGMKPVKDTTPADKQAKASEEVKQLQKKK